MKRAVHFLKKLLIDDEFCAFLTKNRDMVNKENLIMLKKLSILGTSLMGTMSLLSFLLPYLYRMRSLYLPYFLVYALCLVLAMTLAKRRRLYLIFIACALILVTAVFGMQLGIFYTPMGNANLYMVFLIILPMLFMTPPLFTNLFALAICVVFCVLTALVKEVKYYEIDITNCWVSYIIAMFGTRVINSVRMENIDARRRLFAESQIDGLTKLNNRRCFNEYVKTLHSRLLSEKGRVVVYMIDIDIFKIYNDTYGHVQGDSCLVRLGDLFRSIAGEENLFFARYGGEEFIAVSTDAHIDMQAVAEKIVKTIFYADMQFSMSPYGRVTVSVGCADSADCGGQNDFDLINSADMALYNAKERGRNRYSAYGCEEA